MAYANTPNKSLVRQLWDLPLLEQWRVETGHPLAYFGMPGPQIHDLLDWRPLLSYCTCVESPGRTKSERERADDTIGTLHTSLHIHRLSAISQVLLADVEDLIVDGIDKYGYKPTLNNAMPAHRMRFTYDLVNLDFDGGLGYKDSKGASKRIVALKKLLERQEGHSFTLLLTINVRDTLTDEIQVYLGDLRGLDRGPRWQNGLSWYLDRGDGEREYKLKAIVPSFIRAIAEPQAFLCRCYPPISYEGYRQAHMIHFAFRLTSLQRNLPAVSPQDDVNLMNLPLLTVSNGRLQFAPIQHPGFKLSQDDALFDFLSLQARGSLLDTIPGDITA